MAAGPSTRLSTASPSTSSPTCARSDAALIEYTQKFDRADFTKVGLRITDAERHAAAAQASAAQRAALDFAAKRIETFHRATLPHDVDFTDATGTCLGARYRPIDSVGVYVPGGTAAYPSSVLMNIVPAKSDIAADKCATMRRIKRYLSRGRALGTMCKVPSIPGIISLLPMR